MEQENTQVEVTDAQGLFTALEEILEAQGSPGEFSCGDFLPICPNPVLEVNGVGIVPLPIIEATAKEVIKRCQQAPFGRGERTVLDKAVRNTWQLDPAQFSFRNSKFVDFINAELVPRVATGLGCGDSAVKANIYKLLVYEKDQFFVPHKDSEKEEGMFGTLVLTLPSDYEGGELVVSHGDKSVTYSYDPKRSIGEFQFAAFYGDCTHEVQVLTRGYRMALIFNLVSPSRIHIPTDSGDEGKITDILKDWKRTVAADPIDSGIYAYMLEHEYTNAGLSFNSLKNGEAKQGALLVSAAKAAGVKCFLALLQVHQSGYVANEWDYSNSRSVEPVIHMDQSSSEWEILAAVDPHGQRLDKAFDTILLSEKTIGPYQKLKRMDPSKEKIGAPTGNEGISVDRWYHKAAIVLDPGASRVAAMSSKQIMELMQQLADSAQADVGDQAPLEANPHQLARVLLRNASKFHLSWNDLLAVIRVLVKYGKASKRTMQWLIAKIQGTMKGVSQYCYGVADTDTAAQIIILLGENVGWDTILPSEFAELEPEPNADAREEDEEQDEGEDEEEEVEGKITNTEWRKDLSRLFLLAGCRTTNAAAKDRLAKLALPTIMNSLEREVCDMRKGNKEECTQIFALCASLKKTEELEKLAQYIKLEEIRSWSQFKELNADWSEIEARMAQLRQIHKALISYAGLTSPAAECPTFDKILQNMLKKAKASAPQPPVDPSGAPTLIKADLDCTCKYCTQVAQFFKSKEKKLELEVAKSKLSHVRARAKSHVHVTTVNETLLRLVKASPNTAAYESQLKEYKKRMRALHSLEALGGKTDPPIVVEPPAKRVKLNEAAATEPPAQLLPPQPPAAAAADAVVFSFGAAATLLPTVAAAMMSINNSK